VSRWSARFHPWSCYGAIEDFYDPDDAKRFFDEVAQSLAGTEKVLIVGPSSAKLEFSRHLHTHDAALEARVVGIETVDHPSDGQIVAYAKKSHCPSSSS
jgi:hypothetical protein